MGNACERASAHLCSLCSLCNQRRCTARPCKPAGLRLQYEATRRRGDVARPPPWDTAMRPLSHGKRTSSDGNVERRCADIARWISCLPASIWRAGGLASRHRVPVFREDGVRPKIGNHLHSSIWR